jgi:hypothetical protein
VVVAMMNYHNFFGEGWQDRLAEMIREAITMMEQRIKKARAERPELADKTDREIASILKGEDWSEGVASNEVTGGAVRELAEAAIWQRLFLKSKLRASAECGRSGIVVLETIA